MLNATKEDLMPSVSQKDSKDMSPDVSVYMSEIENERAEFKRRSVLVMDAVRIFRYLRRGIWEKTRLPGT